MFFELDINAKWYVKSGDDFINERAEVCALYKITGADKASNFFEMDSEFFIDVQQLSTDLFNQISKHRNELERLEVSVLFYSVAESFMNSHTIDGIRLVDSAYSEAMRCYVSPLQSIRSLEISEHAYSSQSLVHQEICNFRAVVSEPTAFDILLLSQS